MATDTRSAKLEEFYARYRIDRLPLAVGPGWYPLVEQFLEEARVAGELDNLEIHQAKEKFGELRVYHNGSRYLHRVSSKLSRVSTGVCELCGEPGHRRTDGPGERTRCDRCDAGEG